MSSAASLGLGRSQNGVWGNGLKQAAVMSISGDIGWYRQQCVTTRTVRYRHRRYLKQSAVMSISGDIGWYRQQCVTTRTVRYRHRQRQSVQCERFQRSRIHRVPNSECCLYVALDISHRNHNYNIKRFNLLIAKRDSMPFCGQCRSRSDCIERTF